MMNGRRKDVEAMRCVKVMIQVTSMRFCLLYNEFGYRNVKYLSTWNAKWDNALDALLRYSTST